MSLKFFLQGLLLLPLSCRAFSQSLTDRQSDSGLVDPLTISLLLMMTWIYWRGCRLFCTQAITIRQKHLCFWFGMAVLAVALSPPLKPMAQQLFSMHMLQHVVIVLVAAPLLVISQPAHTLLRGMPVAAGRIAGKLSRVHAIRYYWKKFVSPMPAWGIYTTVFWAWHTPFLFNASLQNHWIQALQDFSLLGVALVFWITLFRSRQEPVLYLFATATQASLLITLIIFSPDAWYPAYISTSVHWGLTALEDQRLGGLILWLPTGIVLITTALVLLARTMQTSNAKWFHSSNPGGA